MTAATDAGRLRRGRARHGADAGDADGDADDGGDGVTLWAAWQRGAAMLREAGVDNADGETFWLMEAALGCSRAAVFAHPDRRVTAAEWARAASAFRRRAAREPLQYIVGTQPFLGREFLVRRGVFIPRPDTETLVEAVLAATTAAADERGPMVDVGTGSGCVAVSLALARPSARVVATDCSLPALHLAEENARRHGVGDRVRLVNGDGPAALSGCVGAGTVSVMVSNPPYIPSADVDELPPDVRLFEPRDALDGGPDGLAWYDRLLAEGRTWVRPGGLLVMEVGAGQAGAVCRRARACGGAWAVREVRRDAAGVERVVCLERTRA